MSGEKSPSTPAEDIGKELRLMRSVTHTALEPWALLQPVRDADHRIVDFVYHDINPVAARHQHRHPEELIGRSVTETLPEVARIGLIARYAHCMETGEALILDDFSYNGHIVDEPGVAERRYDIRGVRVGTDYLSLNWRDVNERYEARQRITESEEHYRLLAENSTDVVAHIGDDLTVAWVSSSVEEALGTPPQHWIGQSALSLFHPDDLPTVAEGQTLVDAGVTDVRRLRVFDIHGGVHWAEFHVRIFRDAQGDRDGYSAAFRLIDDEVAAEQALEAANRQRAEAEALYRGSMDNAAVGMCLASPQGPFFRVNRAMCDFFGYDEEALLQKTWMELTGPEYLEADLNNVAELIAGNIDSYEIAQQQFIHADGHPIWGHLSVSCMREDDGSVEVNIAQIVDITEQVESQRQLKRTRDLLRASADAMLDPQVLLEAVRDPEGRVEDFRYIAANRAAYLYLQVSEEELLARNVLDTLPNLEESGLMARYAHCLEDGQPVILSDFSYFNEMLDDARRYDIRATRAGRDLLSVTWSDVTDRFEADRRLADSEKQYRLLADNSSDLIVHVRDGRVVWTSPSVEDVLGAPPEHWIGREVREVVPAEDQAAFAERLAILAAGGTVQQRVRVISIDGVVHWVHLRSTPFYDTDGRMDGFTASLRVIDAEVAAEQALDEARRQRAKADALYRRSIESSAVGMCLARPTGAFLVVNDALCQFFGYDEQTLLTKTWIELTAPDYLQADLDKVADMVAGRIESYRMTKQFIHADGHRIWGDLSVGCLRNPDGSVETSIGQIVDITDEIETRQKLEQARQQQAASDALEQGLIAQSIIPTCIATLDGRFTMVNEAMCEMFGYKDTELANLTWQELTAPEYLAAELAAMEHALADPAAAPYRATEELLHADGHRFWATVSSSILRGTDGQPQQILAQIVDINDEVQTQHRLAAQVQLNRSLAEQLQGDLDKAASYLVSVLPDDLDGKVSIHSRYLPARALGGDAFNYRWLDDDHLLIKMLDVSGHGIEPALLAVSVHNLLRSGTLSPQILRSPQRVLTELNHLFPMERHSGHYFTLWYGIYRPSTRTLAYASAGHPPPLLFTAGNATELPSQAPPIGMLTDTKFTATTVQIPPMSQLLLYSDGVFERALADGTQSSLPEFISLCTELAQSSDWSVDTLIERLRATGGTFTDDCSLVKVDFS